MQPKEEIGGPIKEKREGSLPQHERGRRNPRYQAVVGGLDQWSKMEKMRGRRKMRGGGERAGAIRDRPLYWMGFGKVQVGPLK